MCQCISRQSKTYRRNLLGQLNILGQRHGTLLERALKVDVLDVVAEIGFLVDDTDQAVLDLQVHLCALLDILVEDARSLDGQGRAAVDNKYQLLL